ncbi:ASCH/PUA domain-containing protein [Aeromonas hydrophila]
MIHELKIKPEYFAAVVSGDKTFEIRNNADRNFKVGDTLLLMEWVWEDEDDAGTFTGNFVEKVVSYITDFEQKPGYVVMGLQKQHETPAADWREAGEHDPFGDRYNCDRDALPMGNITDDALANQLFVCDHRHDMQSITLLTAGKERIRWLSRQLESRKQHEHELLANHRKMLIEKSELCDDLLDLIERMVNCMGLAGEDPEKDSYNPIKAWMYDAISTMAGQRPKQSVSVTETIRTAPERIWLQVGDQSSDGDYPFPEHHDEVTWCADSVVACEVPYVRADLAAAPLNGEERTVTISGKGLLELVDFACPDHETDREQQETEIVLLNREAFTSTDGEKMPRGVYAYLAEYPEEGLYGPIGGVDPQGGEPCAIEPPLSSPA